MALQDDAARALSGMIVSLSGWRGVFAPSGDEEDRAAEIGPGHKIIAAAAGAAFAGFLHRRNLTGSPPPIALVGSDTRPTGEAIARALIPALVASGCEARYAGFVAAPEIMAWARRLGERAEVPVGFVYISASHNPIGHNGLKFGLCDGGVLGAE
ncbi:MAG: phosphatidylglycerol lysyltransferase, partial [Treponema sp.]|nr:phosphatidylglycerol lysyltransferase [Treponema sp.]